MSRGDVHPSRQRCRAFIRSTRRVTKAELFLKQCERESCQRPFLHCRSREPGRRYCPECSPLARREREQKAQKKYRASPSGQEQHRDEEQQRRDRRQLECVGDRRCEAERGQVQTRATTAAYQAAVEEKSDARRELEWVLVAWPGLLATAEQLLGTRVACPCCGRAGQVVEVLERDEWRWRRREESS